MKLVFAKIGLLFIFLCFFSCSSVKKVPNRQFLLQKNTLLKNGTPLKDENALAYVQQTPNAHFLGIPLSLFIYNSAGETSNETYNNWLKKHPKTTAFLTKLLSEKQVKRLGESFLITGKKHFLKRMGEAPVILDTIKTKKTASALTSYYQSRGFFNAKTDYKIQQKGKKKAKVTYEIHTGTPYFIDSISHAISSPELLAIFNKNKHLQIIQPQQQYQLNKFVEERNRLTALFRNNGFYNFQQNAINFDIERDTLRKNNDTLINIRTTINDYSFRENDVQKTKPYFIHKLNKIRVFTDYDSNFSGKYDSIQYKDLTIFYKNKLRFKPETLYNAVSLRENSIYKDSDKATTYRQISNLRNFRYPNIQYSYPKNDSIGRWLNTDIYLTPLSRFSLETNSEISRSEIQTFGISLNTSLVIRNIFKGAEILEVTARGTLGNQHLNNENTHFFNVFEYGGDVRLTIPRLWFFINTNKIIPQTMTPQTTLQFSSTIQKNIGLDRHKNQSIVRFSWNPKPTNRATLELLDMEFIRNLNPQNFFQIYQSSYQYLNNISKKYTTQTSSFVNSEGNLDTNTGIYNFINAALSRQIPVTSEEFLGIVGVSERYFRLTANDLVLATNFSYIYNNSIRYFDENFKQFRFKIETAGNIPSLISKIKPLNADNQGNKQIFGINYAQYVKAETEYIKHWKLGRNNSLAFRSFLGIAIPYGNSKSVPFSRSYFAGGSNDNRGWRAYSLGPGRSNSLLEFNEANFKIATNLEYRFPIIGAFKGALFADTGNIWNVFDDTSDASRSLKSLSDLQDIAIGTGVGIRYDFNYFVLRLDLGAKAYNPALERGNRWIQKLDISDIVFNIGINYPF